MDYRTENENEVFKIFRRFTAVCEGEKEKATTDFARLSPSVGMRRLERPTPTSCNLYLFDVAKINKRFDFCKLMHIFLPVFVNDAVYIYSLCLQCH